MAENKKITVKRNYQRYKRSHKNSFLGIVEDWNFKRIFIGLALALAFIVLPMYMFTAEPYDIESVETVASSSTGGREKFEQVNQDDIKELEVADVNQIENQENKVELEAVEKPIMTEDSLDKKIENVDNTANTLTEDKVQVSEEIRAEAIEMLDADNEKQASEKIKTEASQSLSDVINEDGAKKEQILSRAEAIEMLTNGKHERALSYDELSEAIRAERRTKSSLKNEEATVDIDIDSSELESELDDRVLPDNNKRLNEIKRVGVINRAIKEKEKLSPQVKSTENSEVTKLVSPEPSNGDLGEKENIKLDENKIRVPDNKLNNNIKKEVEHTETIKPIAKVSGNNNISRAFLAKGLKEKEPEGIIESPVVVNNKSMTKIYYFTEILNMEGEVLYHYWMWDGKIEFEKELKIWGNRWRASTLKMIPFSKTGQWQARIVNEEGDILNEIQFDVVSE